MKKFAQWTISLLLVSLLAIFSLWKYDEYRREAITGDWSDPDVQLHKIHRSSSPDHSWDLIHYFFHVSQTGQLRHPYHVWKGTAWSRLIEERQNTIHKGYGLSLAQGNEIHTHFLSAPIILVLWSGETVLCRTEDAWVAIEGARCETLPSSFKPPHGLPNARFEKASLSSSPADLHSLIARSILEQSLGPRKSANFYEAKVD